MMNKVKGNMYGWVTHTWNPIRGKCPHDCKYCYMKKFKVGELRLDRKEFHTNIGTGNFIFVGSSTDMWADGVPNEWIRCVLKFCDSSNNTYLFQTKNPKRFIDFGQFFPQKTILGTTIETNRETDDISKSPNPKTRVYYFSQLSKIFDRMISIEPVMDFDIDVLVSWLRGIKPKFVSIGADSQGHNLPEPSPEKVKKLIEELEKFTEVRVKDNLKRISKKC